MNSSGQTAKRQSCSDREVSYSRHAQWGPHQTPYNHGLGTWFHSRDNCEGDLETSFSSFFSQRVLVFFHAHFKHISYKCPFPFLKGDLHTIEGKNKKGSIHVISF